MSFSPSSSSSFFVEYNKDRSSTGELKLVVVKSPTNRHIEDRSILKSKLRTAIDVDNVKREVEITRTLSPHPNVVALRDAYEDDDAVHIVMELCKGGELFDRIVARSRYIERAAAAVAKTAFKVVQI